MVIDFNSINVVSDVMSIVFELILDGWSECVRVKIERKREERIGCGNVQKMLWWKSRSRNRYHNFHNRRNERHESDGY